MNLVSEREHSTLRNPEELFEGLEFEPHSGNDDDFQVILERAQTITRVHWREPDDLHLTSYLLNASLLCANHYPTRDILPHTTSFFASCITDFGVHAVSLWLSAALTSLTLVLDCNVSSRAFVQLLAMIRRRVPYLDYLSIQWNTRYVGPQDRQSARGALQAFLQGIHPVTSLLLEFPASLRVLRVPLDLVAPSDGVWDAITSLQDLEELTLFTRRNHAWTRNTWPRRGYREQVFPVLRTLRISAMLYEAVEIVQATSRRLAALHLAVPRLTSGDELRDALNAIARFCPGLICFTILVASVHSQQTGAWLDVSPLLSLNRLEHLIIRCPAPLPLTDDNVDTMLRAWPRIRHLALNPMPSTAALESYGGTLPTLYSVIRAAETCHYLQHLGLCIGACTYTPGTQVRNAPLTSLDLGMSTGRGDADGRRTAEILLQTFPSGLRLLTIGRSSWVQEVSSRLQDSLENLRGSF